MAEKKYISIEELQKALKKTEKEKKFFLGTAAILTLFLLVILFLIYQNRVLDYAALENVSISQHDNTNLVQYKFKVISGGRVDYYYGDPHQGGGVMTTYLKKGEDGTFHWQLGLVGSTTFKIRARSWLLPRWYQETFELRRIIAPML